jgi:hypothetical protein
MLERSDHESPSPTLANSPEEESRRLHTYTVTENEGVLIAEFPLQRQHDNDCPRQVGSIHIVRTFWANNTGLAMKPETQNSGTPVLTDLGARNLCCNR